MVQKIFLEGGGDIVAGELKSLDKLALNETKHKKVFVLDLSTNNLEKIKKYRSFLEKYFEELGAKCISFISLASSNMKIKENFEDSDLLYLPGGDTEILLKNIKEKGIVELIKKFNGVILGNSAGALVLSKNVIITRDEDNPETKCFGGLGLFNFSVEVHYTGEQDKELSELPKNLKIYTIPERSAIVFSNGEVEFIGNIGLFKSND